MALLGSSADWVISADTAIPHSSAPCIWLHSSSSFLCWSRLVHYLFGDDLHRDLASWVRRYQAGSGLDECCHNRRCSRTCPSTSYSVTGTSKGIISFKLGSVRCTGLGNCKTVTGFFGHAWSVLHTHEVFSCSRISASHTFAGKQDSCSLACI